MFDFVLKHALSLAVSIATVYVPKDEWQQKLDAMPSQTERIAKKKLSGKWQTGSVHSPHTGLTHTYYLHPCADTASKRVLLLLHGFNTDGSIFFNLTRLAETHTLIACNFPEQTNLFTGSLRDFEIIIDDFCSVMRLDTIDLLGNSLGGVIAAFYTARTGHVAINHLVLASTYIPGSTRDNIPRFRKMSDKFLPYPDYKLFYLLTLGSRLAQRIEGADAEKSALGSAVIKQIDWYREIMTMLYWYNGVSDARSIKCPVLILHGGTDRMVPVAEVEASRKLLRRASSSIFEKAGHTLIFTEADWCADQIRKFSSE